MSALVGRWVMGVGFMLAPTSAWAGEEGRPLLVAVEVEPGGGADVSQVRRAIGEELHRPILGPGEAEAFGAGAAQDDLP